MDGRDDRIGRNDGRGALRLPSHDRTVTTGTVAAGAVTTGAGEWAATDAAAGPADVAAGVAGAGAASAAAGARRVVSGAAATTCGAAESGLLAGILDRHPAAPHDSGIIGADDRDVHHPPEDLRIENPAFRRACVTRYDGTARPVERRPSRVASHCDPDPVPGCTSSRGGATARNSEAAAGPIPRATRKRSRVHRARQSQRAIRVFAVEQRGGLGGIESPALRPGPCPVGQMMQAGAAADLASLRSLGRRDSHIAVFPERVTHIDEEHVCSRRIIRGSRRAALSCRCSSVSGSASALSMSWHPRRPLTRHDRRRSSSPADSPWGPIRHSRDASRTIAARAGARPLASTPRGPDLAVWVVRSRITLITRDAGPPGHAAAYSWAMPPGDTPAMTAQ